MFAKPEYLKSYINSLNSLEKLENINNVIGLKTKPDRIGSIVIPIHNEENSIIKTLNALELQEKIQGSSFEVVLVINNTTDKTVELVKKFVTQPALNNDYIIIEETFPKVVRVKR